jgi:ribose-phosphate pyrophosphokinase
MRVLDLTSLENSEIKYKKQNFPDGQQNLLINNQPDEDGFTLPGYYYIAGKSSVYALEPIQIKSRLNNWIDLELISCAIASLKELGVEEFHLYTPYIMGARSDRKFDPDKEGFVGNNYLRDVICPAINLLGCKTVTCLDPHSHCLEMGIKGFKKLDNYNLVQWSLDYIAEKYDRLMNSKDFVLVAPDAGAEHKIFKLAQQIGYTGEIIICSKERDAEGNITRTIVPKLDITKDLIIIDDICDGGATFINIAKEIAKQFPALKNPKIYLIVTHGIFSKGFTELFKYFDGIYCTNSYSDISFDRYASPLQNFYTDKVKQLNVF